MRDATPGSEATEATDADGGNCRAFKTRLHYLSGGDVSSPIVDGTAHYWCVHTMTTIGPDDDLVVPEHCRAGRSCFERK
jgi:hypothetical protein